MRTAFIVATTLAVGMCAIVGMLASPATAQSSGNRTPQAKEACRSESMDACVRRQMGLRDAVSGISIQRGDAERFCNRRSQRC